MYQPIREFRRKLAAGEFCLGVGITLSDPAVTEALGRDVDFFWMDLEHTPLGLESLQAHLMAARAAGIPALVRVPTSDSGMIKRVLDTGAQGVIVPQVRSATEVRAAVAACRYPPRGARGYGPRRASDYGHDPHYLENADQDVFVAVQIENAEAMRELEAIAAVPGLDSLALGPFDLAASLGRLGQVTHPEVVTAIQRVVSVARTHALPVGMGGPAREDYVQNARATGVNWLQAGCDFEYMTEFAGRFFREMKLSARGTGHLNETTPGAAHAAG